MNRRRSNGSTAAVETYVIRLEEPSAVPSPVVEVPRRRRKWPYVVGVIALALVAVFAAAAAYLLHSWPRSGGVSQRAESDGRALAFAASRDRTARHAWRVASIPEQRRPLRRPGSTSWNETRRPSARPDTGSRCSTPSSQRALQQRAQLADAARPDDRPRRPRRACARTCRRGRAHVRGRRDSRP